MKAEYFLVLSCDRHSCAANTGRDHVGPDCPRQQGGQNTESHCRVPSE